MRKTLGGDQVCFDVRDLGGGIRQQATPSADAERDGGLLGGEGRRSALLASLVSTSGDLTGDTSQGDQPRDQVLNTTHLSVSVQPQLRT